MREQPTLRPVLGPVALTTLGIGSVIGTGIFVLTGTAASNHTGPALVVSMIIAAIACALAGLCYAELAAMIPIAGSAYTYAHASAGQFVAWIIGWDLVLEYALSASTIAVGWSGYPSTRVVTRGGYPVPLRPKEYDLLYALLRREGGVVGRAELLREVWG